MNAPKLSGLTLQNLGLLVLRVGVGSSMFLNHGLGKLLAGPEKWEKVGGAMEMVGISFLPLFWGFMAAFAESIGSLMLVLGLKTRLAAFLLACTMVMAALTHLNLPPEEARAGWSGASHALEFLSVSVALICLGGGAWGLDRKG